MRIEWTPVFRGGRSVLIGAVVGAIAMTSWAQLGQRNPMTKPGPVAPDATRAITVVRHGNPYVATPTEHVTYSGARIILQGIARLQPGCSLVSAEWDPGDGSGWKPVVSVANPRILEIDHVYVAEDQAPFTATLRVTDSCGTVATDKLKVRVLKKDLDVEADMAISLGLWRLHKNMILDSVGGVDTGYWTYSHSGGGTSYTGRASATASAVVALEAQGSRPNGNADEDPYVEDVQRGLAYLMTTLGKVSFTGDSDANGNGFGLEVNDLAPSTTYLPAYEGGQVIDAIVASRNPIAVATTGVADGVLGRSYSEIVQDMLDCYAWGQSESGNYRGGWRYSWNADADNSASQWWGIGVISAIKPPFATIVPPFVKTQNLLWLDYSQYYDGSNAGSDGRFGYTSSTSINHDGMNTTPSGMVQLVADDVQTDDPWFAAAEHYMVRKWATLLGSQNLYGMFALMKAMRYSGTDVMTDGLGTEIDWYGSDTMDGDPVDGFARFLVNRQTGVPASYTGQSSVGTWPSDTYSAGNIATAWAVSILVGIIPGPVAVLEVEPETAGPNEPVHLEGAGSYHLDPVRVITAWDWDTDDDGLFGEEDDPDDLIGPFVTAYFDLPVGQNLWTYPVVLRVKDDSVPPLFDTEDATVTIDQPPIEPNADPGGPYCFVLEQDEPFIIDGSNSSDFDGHIVSYGWDLPPLDGNYDDCNQPTCDVTAWFTALGPDNVPYDVALRVIDDQGLPNVDYTTVSIQPPGGACPPVLCDCNECDPIVIDSEVNFTDLDGSDIDGDGLVNGILMIEGLVIDGWGKILVDVPSAEFLVNGDVVLCGEGKIDNYSWFLPEYGPSITVTTCGSIIMRDRSRIRSHGDVYGGHIKLCAEGDIVMEFIAGIECNGFDLPEGEHGGFVDVFAGGRFDMASELAYITVESVDAGQIHIAACSCDDLAIRLKGRLLADGTDPGGFGGDIIVDARNGGIWLPGVDHCVATGEAADGSITLYYRTVLGPEYTPLVQPDPTLVFDGPDHGPCSCSNRSGGSGD